LSLFFPSTGVERSFKRKPTEVVSLVVLSVGFRETALPYEHSHKRLLGRTVRNDLSLVFPKTSPRRV